MDALFLSKIFCLGQLSSSINPSIHNGYQYLSSDISAVWSQTLLSPLHVALVVSSCYKTWFSEYLIKTSVRTNVKPNIIFLKGCYGILPIQCHHTLSTLHKFLLTLQPLHYTVLWMDICSISSSA